MNALTDKQVSFYTGVSLHTLRQGRVRPNLNVPPHVKLESGRVRVLYPVSDLSAWCLANGIQLRGPMQTLENEG